MFGIPYANIGFVGFAELDFSNRPLINSSINVLRETGTKFKLRATSCDLKLSQEITKQNVYDIFYDRNVFQVKPEEIEGSIEYIPTALCDYVDITDQTPRLFERAIFRDYYGRLTSFDALINHTLRNACFKYSRCYINSIKYSVTQGDAIKISFDTYGMDKKEVANPDLSNFTPSRRLLTWADARILVNHPDYSISGERIRSFTANINNNLERFYTGGGGNILKPKDITAKVRDIDGTMSLMGRQWDFARYSWSNSSHRVETSVIEFGYRHIVGNQQYFRVVIPNVVFAIEEIALSNDIIESVIKWSAFPANNPILVEA